MAITMSQSGYTSAKRDLGQPYVQADYGISGINNSVDGGVASVTLVNSQISSY